MKLNKINKLKGLLLKISPEEEKTSVLMGFYNSLTADVVELAKHVSSSTKKSVKYSQTVSEGMTEKIVELKKEIKELQKEKELENKKALKEIEKVVKLYEDLTIKTENYSKEYDKKLPGELKKIKAEYTKMFNGLSSEMERVGNIIPNAWGGSSRTLYLNGLPISNRYSDVNFIPGNGITISEVDNEVTDQADVTITSTGGGGSTIENVYNEFPTDPVDDSNTVFNTLNEFTLGTTRLYYNGVRQALGLKYTETSNSQVTFIIPPQTGSTVWIDYQLLIITPTTSDLLLQDNSEILLQDSTPLELQN